MENDMSSQRVLSIAFCLCIILAACSTVDGNYQVGSPCSCTLNGQVFNLGPLASSNGYPKFETDFKGWNFAYNPCIPFTVKDPECKDVAVCRWDIKGKRYNELGKQSDVQCQLDGGEEELVFLVKNTPSQQTRILLKCNKDLKGLHDALFTVIEDVYPNTVLQIEHKCCCPDACPLGVPLPSEPDVGKWVAVGLAVFFGICTIVLLVHVCRRRRGNQDNVPLLQHGDAAQHPREI